MSDFYDSTGEQMERFGGVLRCTVCGIETPLGDVGDKLRFGWPKHHGLTMTWITARQLDDSGKPE